MKKLLFIALLAVACSTPEYKPQLPQPVISGIQIDPGIPHQPQNNGAFTCELTRTWKMRNNPPLGPGPYVVLPTDWTQAGPNPGANFKSQTWELRALYDYQAPGNSQAGFKCKVTNNGTVPIQVKAISSFTSWTTVPPGGTYISTNMTAPASGSPCLAMVKNFTLWVKQSQCAIPGQLTTYSYIFQLIDFTNGHAYDNYIASYNYSQGTTCTWP